MTSLSEPAPLEGVERTPTTTVRWMFRTPRRRWLLSLSTCLAAAALYFGVLAEDRYVAEAKFYVQGETESINLGVGGSSLIGLTGGPQHDQLRIRQWLDSSAAVATIAASLPIARMLGARTTDVFWWLPEPTTRERLRDRIRRAVVITYDEQAGISILRVEAFAPDDAKTLAETILTLGGARIEELSRRLAEEDLAGARQDLATSEMRVIAARNAIAQYQQSHETVDPQQVGKGMGELLFSLEGALASARGDLESRKSTLRAGTPQVIQAEARVSSIEREIATVKGRLVSTDSAESINELLRNYRGLAAELEFAEKAHSVALAATEQARARAEKKLKRLVVVSPAQTPQEALLPRRIEGFLTTAIVATALHGIVILGLAILRERIS